MTYAANNTQLTRLGPQNDNCPTLWTYISTDGHLTVGTSGYFNALAGKLKVGDLIYWTTAATPWEAGWFVVKSNTRNITAVPPVSGVVNCYSFQTINVSVDSQ